MAVIRIPDATAFNLRITGQHVVGEYTEDAPFSVLTNLIVNFIRLGREAQVYTLDADGRIVADNDGTLARGKYGVELFGYYNGQPWRYYEKNVFQIVNSSSEHDSGTEGEETLTYDITFQVSFGGTGITSAFVDAAIAAHNNDEAAHDDIRDEMGNKIVDVQVDGVSIVDGNKVAQIDPNAFGQVDGVNVNGESVVENRIAEITIPTAVSELANDRGFTTTAEVSEALAVKQDTLTFDTTPTSGSTNPVTSGGILTALTGKADADTTYTKDEVNNLIVPANTTIEVVDTLPASGSANTIYRVAGSGSYSDYGWNGSDWVLLATYSGQLLYNDMGESENGAMTQKAVTDAVAVPDPVAVFYGASLVAPTDKGYVLANGTFEKNAKYYGVFIPFDTYRGEKVRIYPSSGWGLRYAFTTSAPTATTSASILCEGESLITELGGTQPVIDVVPDDCNYIFVYTYSNGTSTYPAKIEVIGFSPVIDVVTDLRDMAAPEIVRAEYVGAELSATVKGNVGVNGKYTLSNKYYGTFIDVSAYRGATVRFVLGEMSSGYGVRYAFTTSAPTASTSSSILCSGESLVTYFFAITKDTIEDVIPSDCNYLYIYLYANGTAAYPEKITIITNRSLADEVTTLNARVGDLEDLDETGTARLFGYYFPNMTATGDLNGTGNATITSDGLTLPVGNAIAQAKLTAFDDEEFQLEADVTTTAKILFYSSPTSDGALSTGETASHVLFDFINGRISIYRAASVNVSDGTGTELTGADFSTAAGKYIISIGRHQRNVFAMIYNKTTKARVRVEATESNYPDVNTPKRPAGWMYFYPSFRVLAGTPSFIRFSGYTKDNLYMLFQGDSYTEGYAGYYENCWAYKACKYFRNSRTCGLSGQGLDAMITQYHDSIKGKVKTDIMVISIGINDMSALTSDALITAWGNTFKTYIDELVADGITPIVNRIWPEGSATAATATKAEKMNNIIRSFGYDGADFGGVTGYSSNTTYYTSGHLSIEGNTVTYNIFIEELAQYKQ